MGINDQLLQDPKVRKMYDRLVKLTARRKKEQDKLDATIAEQNGTIRDLVGEGMTLRYIGDAADLSHVTVSSIAERKTKPKEPDA